MELVAVIPVRDGALPQGGAETVAECAGHAVLAGPDAAQAVGELAGIARDVVVVEVTSVGPAAVAAMLAPLVAGAGVVVLPASPDGRDLAPRLAQQLGRPLLAGAVRVHERGADLARWGGLWRRRPPPTAPSWPPSSPGSEGWSRIRRWPPRRSGW